MTSTEYLILAIAIILFLTITFIVSFVLYERTPKPNGYEDLKPSEEKCSGCTNDSCAFYKESEIKEEVK